jgi:hypothetical protein
LLTAVRNLQPGVTTQAEYEREIRSLRPYFGKIYSGEQEEPNALAIGNQPEWVLGILFKLPDSVRYKLLYWPAMDWTSFSVEPTFEGGKLSALTLTEWHGSGHPAGGRVEVHAGTINHWPTEGAEEGFMGYEAHQMRLADVPWSSHVRMDDRATPEQRRRAMDFKFECFTAFRSCADGRRILDPVITD